MGHALSRIFDTTGFEPLGLCGDWTAPMVWLHNASDALICLACFVLSLVVVWSAYSRSVAFRGMYWMFAACSALCGITHLIELVMFHVPVYRFAGMLKLAMTLCYWAMVVASISAVGGAQALRHAGAPEHGCDRHMQAEAWFQASVERIRLLVDGVRMYGIFVLDLHGRVASWNAGARRINGYDAGEITGRRCTLFYRPEDVAGSQPERELRAAAAEGQYEGEGWRVRQDGTPFRASVLIVPLRDGDGCLRGFVELIGELAEQKAAAGPVKAGEAEFRGLLECTPAAVVVANRAGRIVIVNSEAEKTFGYTRQELLGLDFAALFPKRYRTAAPALRRGSSRKRRVRSKAHSNGIFGLRKDGTVFPVEISLNPIKQEDGYSYITAIRDVTERKRAEAGREARRDSSEDWWSWSSMP